jgi:predicted nucleotidyltransferase
MSVRAGVPVELREYLEELTEALTSRAELDALYVLGSAALGGYEHGRSDVDVVAVTSRSLSLDERRALADAAAAVPCPARRLELVVYPRGSDTWEINLNPGEHVSYDPAEEEPAFWFVIDRAIAEQHAVALLGPPWRETFPPVPPEDLLDALEQSLEIIGALDLARAWAWLETGEWISKPAAEAWLRERIRAEVEAAR